LYQADRLDEAERALDTAIQIEQSTPIAGWGRLMERVQGQPRLWVEQRRTKA
jgi:hypothetical protein